MRIMLGSGLVRRRPQFATVAWGSVSSRATRSPSWTAATPRPMASVDLPEPPFWVAKAIVRIAMAFPSEHSDQTESFDKIAAVSSDHGPPWAGIVRGCREAEISELAPQVAQEFRGFGDRFNGVKRLGKTAPARGRRHELRHALRAGAAHRRRVEAALLPDQPGEEIDRQIIFRRRRCECLTDAVANG